MDELLDFTGMSDEAVVEAALAHLALWQEKEEPRTQALVEALNLKEVEARSAWRAYVAALDAQEKHLLPRWRAYVSAHAALRAADNELAQARDALHAAAIEERHVRDAVAAGNIQQVATSIREVQAWMRYREMRRTVYMAHRMPATL